jgi:hypothetical protein
MTYKPAHHDPDAEPLLCSDDELAAQGFSVGYPDELDPDPEEAAIDALLAKADLEPQPAGAAPALVQRKIEADELASVP